MDFANILLKLEKLSQVSHSLLYKNTHIPTSVFICYFVVVPIDLSCSRGCFVL